MRIMTCNIRFYGANDGEDRWEKRKDVCAQVIRSREPHIVCFQEMWGEQLDDLRKAFPEYDWFGMADDADARRPVNSIFYRRDDFALISSGGYWLSETPHVTGSKSWDSECVRLANWVRLLEHASGREFRVINTHLDHIGQVARENQARLICEDAAAFPKDYPQLLTGDMNATADNAAIRAFKQAGWRDTYETVHGVADPGPTCHDFTPPPPEHKTGRIDWIFCRGKVQARDAEVVRDDIGGRLPSDHYFMCADVAL